MIIYFGYSKQLLSPLISKKFQKNFKKISKNINKFILIYTYFSITNTCKYIYI